MRDVKEFKADFVKSVNEVLERQFEDIGTAHDKKELNFILEQVFNVMILILAVADKVKK